MIKLHIRQDDPANGLYPIRLSLKREGHIDLEAEAKIEFALTEQEQNDLRWYLEDYLQHAGNAETIVAQHVESMILARGEELYEKVLAANDNTRALWYSVRNDVANLRVEVSTGVVEAASIPWELMRDPVLKSPISLRVESFVRVQSSPNISFVPIPAAADGRVRLLYIASRPGGASDVELRAVANRLVRDLGPDRARFDIKALRPPTFEQLQIELNDAHQEDRPYHIVHFDGHGTYRDLSKTSLAHWATTPGERGYLLFEYPGEDGVRPIDGETLGKWLHDRGVPVLVLNACQSAMLATTGKGDSALDVHDEVRAIGSLAQAVIDQGVPAVLGMRYSVFVVTAAEYIGLLYKAMAKGRSFGEAATEGRRILEQNNTRWVGLVPRSLQDWFVPIAYEAGPIELLPAQDSLSAGEQVELDPVQNNRALLRYVPEEGFIGRDETLLALDRAFDEHRVVLLHAYAGQGKSSTAVEFARWYALTGGLGVQPFVFFASFESHIILKDLLDQIGQAFSPALTNPPVDWVAENDPLRRIAIVKRILRTFPILWIWDNVEPVAGFPEGTESQWTAEEQAELRDFLKQLKLDTASKVKILATSRRDEQEWLGGIPHRILMSRMRNSDAARLAIKLSQRRLNPAELAAWQPLLNYCAGNPLTLRVLAGQALKAGIKGQQAIADFVEKIRSGEEQIKDADEKQGRDKSLGASLAYGFRNAFSETELPVIALLHLFQGTVSVLALSTMGRVHDNPLPELNGFSEEDIADLLRRSTEIGLLSQITPRYFSIHPALPWFLRQLFVRYYDGQNGRSSSEVALRTWTTAIGWFGDYYLHEFNEGKRNIVRLASLEEANLLQARRAALQNKWWNLVTSPMQGLRLLYDYHGRSAEWARLVYDIRLEYCTVDNEPIEGREDDYFLFMGYLVDLASHYERDLPKAIALHEKMVDLRRRAVANIDLNPAASLSENQLYLLRVLAMSLAELGHLQERVRKSDCVGNYRDAIALCQRAGDKGTQAIAEWHLGNAYYRLPEIVDLVEAEKAYKRSLDLLDPEDNWGRSKCMSQLGVIHFEHFKAAQERDEPVEKLLHHIQEAERHYLEALRLCPIEAFKDLAPIHNDLGRLYVQIGQLEKAREHYERDAHYEERAGNRFGAGQTRMSMALMYLHAAAQNEPSESRSNILRARAYAEAGLRDFQHYQGRVAEQEERATQLIETVDALLADMDKEE